MCFRGCFSGVTALSMSIAFLLTTLNTLIVTSPPTPCTHTLVLYNISTIVGIAAMIHVPHTGTKIEIV